MKDKKWLAPQLGLVLMVLVSLACGASSQATPPASAKGSGPAVTEVHSATQAPESAPDLSTARISLNELPQGFKEISTDDILAKHKASGDSGLQPDVLFAFVKAKDFHLIMGMDFLLVDSMDRLGFNLSLEHAEKYLKELAGSMGVKNIREQKVLEGMDSVGEKQTAITMVADFKDVPMRVNAVIFRRDVIGGLLISMAVEDKPESISIQELGKLFDQHIQESLKQAE